MPGYLFALTAIMESSIMFARPVMSLDARHLKSQWKGTLYAASVLTEMDNVYPIAFAITESNEDFLVPL
jgi:hypothetical protein